MLNRLNRRAFKTPVLFSLLLLSFMELTPSSSHVALANEFQSRLADKWWRGKHEGLVLKAKETGSLMQIYGDSITDYISLEANLSPFTNNYPKLRPENFGISGDTTDDLLWRITNGELGATPQLYVLMIGTNDLTRTEHNPAKTAANIKEIVDTMREKKPEAKVLVLGIFPRDPSNVPDADVHKKKIKQINNLLSKLDNGSTVRFLDISKAFLDKKGEVRKDLFPDYLHPNLQGYKAWSDAMKSRVTEMTQHG